LKTLLIAVHEEAHVLETLQRELVGRYASDYEILCEASAASGLERLEELHRRDGVQVIALFAASQMTTMSGLEFLRRAHALHPIAQRVLLIPWANRSDTRPLLKAISMGQIDRYVTQPGRSPDERFHHLVTELLRNWQEPRHAEPVVTVIAERSSARSHQIRDLLQRSGLPFRAHDADSEEGRAMLQRVQRPTGPFPVLVRYDGLSLADPTNEQAATALGARHSSVQGIYVCSSSAPVRPAYLRRSMARRRDFAPWSSTERRLAGRPAPVHSFATISAFRSASPARSSAIERSIRHGPSEPRRRCCARPSIFAVRVTF